MIFYLIVVIILILIISIYYSYIKVDISKYDIKNNKIDKNIKIMLLSDLHNRDLINKITNIAENEKPDIIIISGDMINDNKNNYDSFLKLSKSLDKYKTYYTFGNHEHLLNSKNINKYYKELLKTNMIILNDSKVKLSNNICLYGIDFSIDCYESNEQKSKVKEYLNNTFNEINENKYNILIAHNPLWASIYSKKGFDLSLGGHVHGGVIKLPLLGGILSPEFNFFPEYYEGKQKVNKMTLIVSRGLGFCRYITFRLFNPAEVVIINLMKNK